MAGNINTSEYHAFASFTFSGTTYYVGTQTEYRAQWYDGVIVSAPQLGMTFGDELAATQAANVDLVLGGDASSTYRTLAQNNVLHGMAVTVTLVMRQTWTDNTTTEQTYTQILTVVGVALEPSKVTLNLQDIEETRLQQLYPFNTWQASDWPDISSDDAGKPICEPVGTALKFPCVLLRNDTTNNEYWYGVCSGALQSINISSINTGTKTITLSAAPTIPFTVGQVILIGSGSAQGRYTVASGSGTTVVTNEAIPTSVGFNILFNPVPLTVYRNKRIVAAGEYTTQISVPDSALTNANFASGGTGWTTTNVGAGGSVTFTTGNCAITSVNNSNYDYINQSAAGTVVCAGALLAVAVTVGAGSDAVIGFNNPPAMTYRCTANKTTTIFLPVNATGSPVISLGVWNNAGTTNIKSIAVFPLSLTLLKFTQPQIDFNGTQYTIEADALGVESRDGVAEVQRLLTKAGATTDGTTFAAAKAQTFAKLVDCDHGRTGQRRIDAILDDLLFIARAGLSRNSAGAYTIWQDVSGSVTWTYDESLGDPVQVRDFRTEAQPSSIAIAYAPSSADANQMQVNPLTRAVAGGILAPEQPREIRYLRDATTADQAACYRALRRYRNGKSTAAVYRQQINIGDIMALTSPRNWVGQKLFTVWDVQRVVSGNQLTLREYDSAVYTYTAGTLPPNAPTGYQPDYSFTPPSAPTALKVMATAARVANDGTTTSYATVQATPPSVNWQALWFAAVHNVTGEISLASGASIGGGNYGTTLGPLRPGEVYRLQCYAVNSNNLQGVVQSTFDATAIGGGASVTTFTAAGQATAPPTVASCTAAQATAKHVRVTWPAVTSVTNLYGYVLERQIGAGSFAEVWRGQANTYNDTSVIYTNSYTYRVRALDTYGNFSAAYATSGAVSPAGNVTGGTSGDIGATTVDTSNRTNTTTVSSSWSNATFLAMNVQIGITHSLGRIPVLGAVNSGVAGVVAGVHSVTTSAASITMLINNNLANNSQWTTQSTTVNAVPSSHTHNIAGASCAGTFTIDCW